MHNAELLVEIEDIRQQLNELVKRYPLFSKRVVEKSRQLDRLLNQYRQSGAP